MNRFGLMDLSLLRDQVVMDFGCNTGQSCLKAVQAGAREVIGIEGAAADVEVVVLGERYLRERGLSEHVLHLNSIGDENCRPAYRAGWCGGYSSGACFSFWG